MKSAITCIPLKSSKIPEIIRVKVWWTGKEKQRVILNLSSSKSLIFSCYIYICTFSNISKLYTFSPLISMFSAIKNSFWLINSIIYQTPSKSFFLSAIPFKNQKHLKYNQLQFSFFPWQILHLYTFFSFSNLPYFYLLHYAILLYTPNIINMPHIVNEYWT